VTQRDEAKLRVFMQIATALSSLGTCPRQQVGAVLVREGRAISWGYNGAPPGFPHCNHPVNEPCQQAIHAELNAVVAAARAGISTDGASCFVTLSPCVTCSFLLIAAGVSTVYYKEEYRDTQGLDILELARVNCWAL